MAGHKCADRSIGISCVEVFGGGLNEVLRKSILTTSGVVIEVFPAVMPRIVKPANRVLAGHHLISGCEVIWPRSITRDSNRRKRNGTCSVGWPDTLEKSNHGQRLRSASWSHAAVWCYPPESSARNMDGSPGIWSRSVCRPGSLIR